MAVHQVSGWGCIKTRVLYGVLSVNLDHNTSVYRVLEKNFCYSSELNVAIFCRMETTQKQSIILKRVLDLELRHLDSSNFSNTNMTLNY